jgi:hypothetical protein
MRGDTARVNDSLRDPLMIEMRNLFPEVKVF